MQNCCCNPRECDDGFWSGGPAEIWRSMPLHLALHVASFLPPNEIAYSARALCSAAAARFSKPEHKTIHLSQPVPREAFFERWVAPGAMRNLTSYQREKLLILTAGSGGHPANLIVAIGASCISPCDERIFEAAGRSGCLETCQLLWPLECGVGQRARGKAMMLGAAKAGKEDIIIWLHQDHSVPLEFSDDDKEEYEPEPFSVMATLLEAGHETICHLLHNQYCVPYTGEFITHAASRGNLTICQSLHQAVVEADWCKAYRAASAGGHDHVCLWIVSAGCIYLKDAVKLAASEGRTGLVDRLLNDSGSYNNAPVHAWWHEVLSGAATGCTFNTLRALFEHPKAMLNGGRYRLVGKDKRKDVVLSSAVNSHTDDWQEKVVWLMEKEGMHESVDMEEFERLRIAVRRTKNDCLDDILARLVWLREKGLLSMSQQYISHRSSMKLAESLLTEGNTSYQFPLRDRPWYHLGSSGEGPLESSSAAAGVGLQYRIVECGRNR
ncbi:hypothetical protein VaNZ11_013897 [Volvox africanus]|uniref:F-box domain-containing protein n=1 Tax=Volvox africanus TaxID=51714 RepID=A0ABQ5SHA2_9CHLO|nr:hypothetical protein VaNZ11_013897 [Volvox africanus]